MKLKDTTIQKIRQSAKDPSEIVWTHNAAIVIEFLSRTFLPLDYFLKDTDDEGRSIKNKLMAEERLQRQWLKQTMPITADMLYQMYLQYRDYVDYTRPIESKYRFTFIINRMRYNLNGWEFLKTRHGREQVPHFEPLMLRTQVDDAPEIKETPVTKTDVSGTLKDLSE